MKFETTVNSGDFKDAMENMKLALSKDKYRPDFQKIKIVIDKNRIELWALDGYRIHTQTLASENYSSEKIQFLTEYAKIPKSQILKLEVDTDNNTITYDCIGQKITKNITDAERFPKNLEEIKEKIKSNFKIAVDPKFLIEALQGYKNEKCMVLDFDTSLNGFVIRKPGQEQDYNLVLPIRLPDSER